MTPDTPGSRRAPFSWLRLFPQTVPAILAAATAAAWGQTTQQAAVLVSAVVSTTPPSIAFSWTPDPSASSYTVYRRLNGVASWGTPTTIPGGAAAASWVDSSVTIGTRYEYWFNKSGTTAGKSYVASGIETPAVEARGKLILLVDATKVIALGARLDRLIGDLVGDGWTVLRHDVLPTQSVPSIKALIVADYNADPTTVRSVFLLGRIPVPYSGIIAPDGHPDHQGAWPADVYYGDINGTWTDVSANSTTASRAENQNVHGDGKFDQSQIPSDVDLMVGRVDLSNMTAFGVAEDVLLQNYLDKDHDYRHRVFAAAAQAVIDDNFGYFGGEAFAATGWRNFAGLFGASNVFGADYFTSLNTVSGPGFLWSYGCGGGSYTSAGGVGSTTDFTTSTNRNVFTILFGSYFGDWDSQNNFLRAPLCSGWTLASFWAGRPHWSFHQMGMGDTLGHCARFSQNDTGAGGFGTRSIHVALMGDPTLREHVLAPPANVTATAAGSQMILNWGASAQPVAGYHVYRAGTAAGPFTRLTVAPVSGLGFTDAAPTSLAAVYMVRAVAIESGSSGSYWNLSQGITATACPAPVAITQSVGSPCGTTPPSLNGTPPIIGQSVTLSVSSGAPNATGAIYAGALAAPLSIGSGCLVYLDVATAALFTPIQLSALGAWSLSTTVPNDPALLCRTAEFQALIFESSGIALSNALHVMVGN